MIILPQRVCVCEHVHIAYAELVAGRRHQSIEISARSRAATLRFMHLARLCVPGVTAIN